MLAVPAKYIVKINKSEKLDKYLDLSRELKKAKKKKKKKKKWNMQATAILIVISGLETVLKGSEKKIERIGNHMKNLDHSNYSIDQPEYKEESWRYG